MILRLRAVLFGDDLVPYGLLLARHLRLNILLVNMRLTVLLMLEVADILCPLYHSIKFYRSD
jgi:hypothetical protein